MDYLNGAQKNIIDSAIQFQLEDIVHSLIDEPELAEQALQACKRKLTSKERQQFAQKNVLGSIEQIQTILNHPYPQNRSTGNPYLGLGPEGIDAYGYIYAEPWGHGKGITKEKKGLLGLTARDNNLRQPHVTKAAVVNYIVQCIDHLIDQLRSLSNELKQFIKKHKNTIQELLQNCNSITLNEINLLGVNGLNKLIDYSPAALSRILDKAKIPLLDFIAMEPAECKKLVDCSDKLIKLIEEAGISGKELCELPKDRRTLFLDYAPQIVRLIREQKNSFEMLKRLGQEDLLNKVNEISLAPTQPLPRPTRRANWWHRIINSIKQLFTNLFHPEVSTVDERDRLNESNLNSVGEQEEELNESNFNSVLVFGRLYERNDVPAQMSMTGHDSFESFLENRSGSLIPNWPFIESSHFIFFAPSPSQNSYLGQSITLDRGEVFCRFNCF